ncbi:MULTISPECIES: poly-gamma-glutamate hydrolase family protein [unclassified Rhizobium]|uniref:poly-gamma-glutamate hydrolase family protein n=1 Tax=unclassified Rhizobium TaxID=2613769 RepID=UPI000EA981A3|nr:MULTISPECIES: poly-gamma-glutamate hydrolase family protein [unclassified Rhizobium]AYG67667.1 replication protein [Rhizobium sp. CCGE531]AYG74061.1 replication protein [Rhizobium sp. CCGE532]
MTRQPDRYGSFSALCEHETEGIDYRIRIEDRSSNVAIITPHGGFIEPATSDVALAIARDRFSLYCFEGLDPARLHHELHITSDNFDEPVANSLVAKSSVVVAIHGRTDRDDPETSWIGGLGLSLRDRIVEALCRNGFAAAVRARGEALAGTSVGNICNRGKRHAGVQIEIPRGVRDALMADTEKLERYARAVRHAIDQFDHTPD